MKRRSVLSASGLVVAAGAGAGAGCALRNPIRPQNGWKEVTSAHVRLLARDTYRAEPVIEWLEYSHAGYRVALERRGVPVPRSLDRVEGLFLDEGTSAEFVGLFGYNRSGITLAEAPAGAPLGAGGLMVLPGWKESAVMRALAHVFVHRIAPRAPIWFHAGVVGVLAGTTFLRGDSHPAAYLYLGPTHLGPGTRNWIEPLEVVFSATPAVYDRPHRGDHVWQTAAVLATFLMYGDEGPTIHGDFPGLVRRLGAGEPTVEALAATYPRYPVATLREHLRTWFIRRERALRIPLPRADARITGRRPVDPGSMRRLLDGLERLGLEDGWGDWVPREVLAQASRRGGGAF